MSKFQHSLGNNKISFLKFLSSFVSKISLEFAGLFFDIDKKNSEIIISSSFHAPWKEDLEFANFYLKIDIRSICVFCTLCCISGVHASDNSLRFILKLPFVSCISDPLSNIRRA